MTQRTMIGAAFGALTALLFIGGISEPASATTCTSSVGSSTCESPANDLTSVSPTASSSYLIDQSSQFFGDANPDSTAVLNNISGLVAAFPSIGTLSTITDISSGGITANFSGGSGTFSLASGLGSMDWGVTEGGSFVLLTFASLINSIDLSVLHGIHDVFAFNVGTIGSAVGSTPLPASLPLLGTVLGCAFLITRWRRRRGTPRLSLG